VPWRRGAEAMHTSAFMHSYLQHTRTMQVYHITWRMSLSPHACLYPRMHAHRHENALARGCAGTFVHVCMQISACTQPWVTGQGRIANRYPSQTIPDDEHLVESIQAPALRAALVQVLFKDINQNVHLFRMCDATVTQDLAFRMRSICRMADSEITKMGTVPDNLYMVRMKAHESLVWSARCAVAHAGVSHTRCALAKWSSAA
jgi:hypothetical protein